MLKKLNLLLTSGFCLFGHFSMEALSPSEEKTMQESFSQLAQEPDAVTFQPPSGWHLADPKALPPSVKVMVVGKGKHEFPPSINLATEQYAGTLKQYLKTIKAINDSQGAVWKDLGAIQTEAGAASLSQADVKTEWGETRMMHVVFLKNGIVYILTAASLKDEFPQYYKEFFSSLRSLRINKNAFEMVSNAQKRSKLETATENLKKAWQAQYDKIQQASANVAKEQLAKDAFENGDFQKTHWEPFKVMLQQDYQEMNPVWHSYLLNKLQQELTS